MPTPIPQSVIDKDHELDDRTEKASEALAKHRWRQCLDPTGPQYPIKTYARAVNRSDSVIRYYARGWALYVERQGQSRALTLQDAVRLATQSEEQQEFSEAIAEGSGRSVGQVARGDQRHRTRAVIEQARGRAERRGGNPVDHARDIAAEERRIAESRRERVAEERERHTIRYVYIEGRLGKAQRELLAALKEAEGVPFDNEELELLRDSVANVRAVLDLLDARVSGTPNIDWDAELARLGDAS